MELLPEWAPGIHPLIIHFPVALLSLAVVLTVLALFYYREWITKATLGLYTVGTLSALASYISGRSAADSIGLNLKAEVAIGTHSDWGLYTLVYFGIFTVIYYGVVFMLKKESIVFKLTLAALALLGFFILGQTAEHGGRLVFEYGLGVQK
ncbi:MAG: hypothetical protein L3J29_10890 [Cyclobacteriaceae bacterium]|nr:hypothetical protein [Cyclobacteriaceae bacterium]